MKKTKKSFKDTYTATEPKRRLLLFFIVAFSAFGAGTGAWRAAGAAGGSIGADIAKAAGTGDGVDTVKVTDIGIGIDIAKAAEKQSEYGSDSAETETEESEMPADATDESAAAQTGADFFWLMTNPGWDEETEILIDEEEAGSFGDDNGSGLPEGETDDSGDVLPEDSMDDDGDSAPEEAADGGSSSEEETDDAGSAEDETEADPARQARRQLASLPGDFCIPMTMPEEADSGLLPILALEDTKKLHGYHLLLSEEEEEKPEEAYRSSLSMLKALLLNRIAGYDGEWSVYVKNLDTDESFVINDQPMKSASVMKLFIMGTVYTAFESGDLERTDEIVSLLNSMITVSSNDASNRLLYLLGNGSYAAGIKKVNEFIQEYGFSDQTIEYNGFSSSAATVDENHNNQVTAADCGRLLEDIYRRTWMNRETSNEMEKLLLGQQTRYKIPAGLPDGVVCGNKSGEMDGTQNDAAIIYGEECDYILVVLSSDWSSSDKAISRIAAISKLVYEFLN